MIRLATVSVNSAPAPGKRRRNAMPAASETTTVVAITISREQQRSLQRAAEIADRLALEQPANQCSDTPFIGKVSPPSGPWNDSIMMVSVGPYRNSMNSAKNAHSAVGR